MWTTVRNTKDQRRERKRCTEVPDRTNARERLGMRTISSIGFSPGTVWRDKTVYDSSWAKVSGMSGHGGGELTEVGSSALKAKRISSPFEHPI